MATIFSSFLFSYGVVDIRYSLLVSANKLSFVLIGFGMFPTLFCSVALRTGGTVFLIKHQPDFKLKYKTILEPLKLVLHKNNFQFNGEHYLQIGGTAMGTKVAPSYANLFMARLEEKLLERARTDLQIELPLYLRYIDDIFFIFPYSETKLQEFMTLMNSFHRTIKFTEEHSREEIIFLDTYVKVTEIHYTQTCMSKRRLHIAIYFTHHAIPKTALKKAHLANFSASNAIAQKTLTSKNMPKIWKNTMPIVATRMTSSRRPTKKPGREITTI